MAFASDSTTAPARPLLPALAAGLRQAWAAARDLLPADHGEAGFEPAAEVAAPLLPLPAPLPSLPAALSRRRAFRAVAVPLALASPTARGIIPQIWGMG